jgi:ribose/xylose/arabinose/galactoside ABC-type transport system permease subunit
MMAAMLKVTEKKVNPYILQKLVIFGILVFFIIILSVTTESFLTVYNISNIIRQSSFTIITGCAALFLVVSGNIDLSVGSVVSITGVLFAMMCKTGFDIWTAALISLLVGAAVGLINATVSVRFKIPAIIATLGSMFIFRGLSYTICSAHPIEGPFLAANFSFLGRGMVLGIIPFPLIIVMIIVSIFLILEKKTVLGKYSIAIGGNKMAAILSGININRIQSVLFILTGAMAGLSGAMMGSRLGVGDPTVGQGFELDVMSAVILGGTNINGGEGSITGTIIGASIIGVLNNGMNLLGIQSFYQYVVKGVVVLLAIIFDQFMKSKIK